MLAIAGAYGQQPSNSISLEQYVVEQRSSEIKETIEAFSEQEGR
jgi:hypothetical protein